MSGGRRAGSAFCPGGGSAPPDRPFGTSRVWAAQAGQLKQCFACVGLLSVLNCVLGTSMVTYAYYRPAWRGRCRGRSANWRHTGFVRRTEGRPIHVGQIRNVDVCDILSSLLEGRNHVVCKDMHECAGSCRRGVSDKCSRCCCWNIRSSRRTAQHLEQQHLFRSNRAVPTW